MPATCGHFKAHSREQSLIELEEEKAKPTWEAYQGEPSTGKWQVNDKEKRKGKEEENKLEEATANESNSGWTNLYSTVERNFLPWEPGLCQIKTTRPEPTITASHAIENAMATQNDKESGTTNHVLLIEKHYSMKKCGMTFLVKEEHATLHANAFPDIETNPEDFHEHYQNLAPTREEQEEHLAQLNT
ncbi:hypothetical protein G9A89_006873 [Geosiphon pyriformis]|nr:hypothetical protein G9A89_006873 [Geosiphon pyriformis]